MLRGFHQMQAMVRRWPSVSAHSQPAIGPTKAGDRRRGLSFVLASLYHLLKVVVESLLAFFKRLLP